MVVDRGEIAWNYVQSDGLRIHWGEIGSGPPLICLHGTGPGSDAYGNFRANIVPLADQHRVILIDFPRFGESEKVVVKEPRLDFLSRIVRGVMDAIDVPRAHFLGNSMGGQVAMKLAIDSPERVERLVLMAPAAVGYSVFTPMPTEAVRQIAGYYKGEGPSLEKMRRLLKSLAYDADFVTDEMIEQRYAASIRPEVLEVNQGPHWERQSLDGELEDCAAPTLLVWGQDDRATALDIAHLLLRRLPDARLHVFARCGHWAQAEHADEFNRLALDFLRP
ncbi:MAG: alpha/beta fold hydrolase [Dehalococcoidia bacterium]